jgi:hypothetical protein
LSQTTLRRIRITGEDFDMVIPPPKKKPERDIPEELPRHIRAHLGERGVEFFRKVLEDYGTVHAILDVGGMPHPIHFREGMNIRNAMRASGYCDGWTDHELDEYWDRVVIRALFLEEKPCRRYSFLKACIPSLFRRGESSQL